MTLFSFLSLNPKISPMISLDVQIISRISWHSMNNCFHHSHYKTSSTISWKYFRIISKSLQRHFLQMFFYFVYSSHSLYLHRNSHYINDSSMFYRTILSFLFKRNQWFHIYDIINYYYIILWYIYLTFFILIFYKYIMIIISWIISIL